MSTLTCPRCQAQMILKQWCPRREKYVWWCTNSDCRFSKSLSSEEENQVRITDRITGDITVLKGDNPDPKKYDRDSVIPNLYHLRFPLCIYQEEKQKMYPCKRVQKYKYCNLLKLPVTAPYCQACKERKETT